MSISRSKGIRRTALEESLTSAITSVPGRFSSGFADALSYRVAADLALPIANDMNLREHLYKLYIQVLDQAKVVASRNKTHRIPITGRYRGARQ